MEVQHKQYQQETPQAANRARHASQCSICLHPQREFIEDEWVNWGNTTVISERFSVSKDAIYRHARYLDLFRPRHKNLKSALEKIIERLDLVPVSGSVVLGAIREYAKLGAAEAKLEVTQAAVPAGMAAVTKRQEQRESEPIPSANHTLLELPETEQQEPVTEIPTVQ
jgi:hypothetical protein